MGFRLNIRENRPGVFEVTIQGPLDAQTQLILETKIMEAIVPRTQAIILNMAGVNYISSLGLKAVFQIMHTMNERKGKVLLTNVQPQIQKVLDVIKMMPDAIFKSVEEADEYLNAIQKRVLGE